MATFSKILKNTDLKYRLSFPTKHFKSLPFLARRHATEIRVRDESGHLRTFICYSRRNSKHPKPVLSKGWLAFVRSKKLQVGDRIKFSAEEDHVINGAHEFKIEVEKPVKEYTRRNSKHPKPVLSNGWLPLIRSKKLRVGDRIKFSMEDDHVINGAHEFKIKVE